MTNITEGIIIGVSSGVIVSLFLGIKYFIQIQWNKHKEIKRLRNIIENFRPRIYRAPATAKSIVESYGLKTTAKELQKASFDEMKRQLNDALDRGSPNLSYDKKQQVGNVLYSFSIIADNFLKPEAYRKEIFEKLEKLKWLKLPPWGTPQ